MNKRKPNPAAQELGRLRAKKLSRERRVEIATMGGQATKRKWEEKRAMDAQEETPQDA